MKKILALALFAVALVSCRQTMQTDGFKLSGHLEGLQVGDTLFLKTFLLPDWKEDGTDTILVEQEGIFSAAICRPALWVIAAGMSTSGYFRACRARLRTSSD